MRSLYEITGDFLTLMEMLEDADEDSQMIIDTLEGMGGELEVKAENYAKIIRYMQGDAEILDKEAKRINAKKKTIENNINRLKDTLMNSMILTEKEKIKAVLFSFTVKSNPPKLIIDDLDRIPKKYKIPQPDKIDEAGIKEYLKGNKKLAYAHLESGKSLLIR